LSERKNKARFVLDTYAALTYLKEEPGWQKVRTILWNAYKYNSAIFLNTVNLGGLYYIIYREYGAVSADKAISLVKLWPIKLINANEELSMVAGRIKAENKLSFADAFVAATASIKKAIIVTGDNEFKSLEDILEIHWLPKNR
jgi:predicted nucleic acid-binding protein